MTDKAPPVVNLPEDVEKCYELFKKSIDYIYLQIKDVNDKVIKPNHFFLSGFMQNLRFEPNTKSDFGSPFAAVRFSSKEAHGTFIFVPENMSKLAVPKFARITVHEILHIACSHTKEFKVMAALGMLANWAMDMEIEDIMVRMGYPLLEPTDYPPYDPAKGTPVGITTDTVPKILGITDPALFPTKDQDWQYYLKWLLEHMPPEMQEELRNQGNGDHEWEIVEDADAEMAQGMHEANAIGRALEAADNDDGFTAPGQINAKLKKLLKALKPEVKWQKYIPEIISNCGAVHQTTRRRFNKHDTLGTVTLRPRGSVGVVMDTSASMQKKEKQRILGEIKAIAKLYEVDVYVQMTSHGKASRRWKLSEQTNLEEFEVTGGGGTNLKPGIMSFIDYQDEDHANESPGAVIVMTDGGLGLDSLVTPEEANGMPIYWMITRPVQPFKGHRVAGKFIYANFGDDIIEPQVIK